LAPTQNLPQNPQKDQTASKIASKYNKEINMNLKLNRERISKYNDPRPTSSKTDKETPTSHQMTQ
jgi:hypothetical protein